MSDEGLRRAAEAFIAHLDTAPKLGWEDNDPAILSWAATEYRLQEGIRAALAARSEPRGEGLRSLTRYAMVGDLNSRHMDAIPDGEYLLRSDALAATPPAPAQSEPRGERLREAEWAALMQDIWERFVRALRTSGTLGRGSTRRSAVGTHEAFATLRDVLDETEPLAALAPERQETE